MAIEIKKLGKVEKYIGKVGNYLTIRFFLSIGVVLLAQRHKC